MMLRVARREVRERWWIILAGALLAGVVVGAAGHHLVHKKQWTATTTLIVSPDAGKVNAVSSLEIAQALVTNPQVIDAAAGQLHVPVTAVPATISTTITSSSETLAISVASAHEATSLAFAQALGTAVVDHLAGVSLANYERELSQANAGVVTATAQVDKLTQELETDLKSAPPKVNPDELDLALREKLATATAVLKTAQTRAQTLSSQGPPVAEFQALGLPAASLTSTPLIPSSLKLRVALAAVLGALLALIVLAVLAKVDTRIRTREAAEAAFGAPLLAEIPHVRQNSRRLPSVAQPRSPAARAYQGLAVGLVELQAGSGSHAGHEGRIIAVTSANTAEGRSNVAANLAVSATLLEHHVLLVDADPSRPGTSDLVGVHSLPAPGEEVADSASPLGEMLQASNVAGLDVLALAAATDRPLSIVPRLRRIAEHLRSEADTVVVDVPPLLSAPESLLLAGLADTVVLVCRWGRTTRSAAWRVAEQLERVGAHVAGVVLVDAPGSERSPSNRSQGSSPKGTHHASPKGTERPVAKGTHLASSNGSERPTPAEGRAPAPAPRHVDVSATTMPAPGRVEVGGNGVATGNGVGGRVESGLSTGGSRSTAPQADENTAG
jgi:Mrp family chromosome partitioning ATPase